MECENPMTTTLNRPQTRDQAKPKPTFRQRLSFWDLKASPYLYISPFFIVFAVVGLSRSCTRSTSPCTNGTCSRARENLWDWQTSPAC